MPINEAKNILKNQVGFLKARDKTFSEIEILDYLNFSILENLK